MPEPASLMCYVNEITKRGWFGVTERVRAPEAPMRKCMQNMSQITQIHPISWESLFILGNPGL